jgi:hypothetical protein
MSPSIILHQATKSISVAYSEREMTFGVNLPTNLGELTFKNTSKCFFTSSLLSYKSYKGLKP